MSESTARVVGNRGADEGDEEAEVDERANASVSPPMGMGNDTGAGAWVATGGGHCGWRAGRAQSQGSRPQREDPPRSFWLPPDEPTGEKVTLLEFLRW